MQNNFMPEQPQANYIKHVNNFLDTCFADNRLKPAHISLYMALFNIWNQHRCCTDKVGFNRIVNFVGGRFLPGPFYTLCLMNGRFCR